MCTVEKSQTMTSISLYPNSTNVFLIIKFASIARSVANLLSIFNNLGILLQAETAKCLIILTYGSAGVKSKYYKSSNWK